MEFLAEVLLPQFEGAASMLAGPVLGCSEGEWEGKLVNYTMRELVYHTLFFWDYYLTPVEAEFALREVHRTAGDERVGACAGLSREETLKYLDACREKTRDELGRETEATLRGPCGFQRRGGMTRAELHVYNLRHVQHHVGAVHAYLRGTRGMADDQPGLTWVGRGWK